MNQWTIEVGEDNFAAAVLQRSKKVPILVDFWAPWCGLCRVLGPLLEKLAQEYAGEFVLAKVNVDDNPSLAGEFGIQGIPAVKLFRDGELASEFTGALPEPMIREFLSRLLPSASDKRVMEAIRLEEEGKGAEANTIYRSVLQSEPNHAKALLGLGRVLMNEGDPAGALEILEKVSLVAEERPEAERLIARLKLQSGGAQNTAELRVTLKSDPDNLDVRFKLAQALAASERYDAALAAFLIIVKTDRQLQDDSAHTAMI